MPELSFSKAYRLRSSTSIDQLFKASSSVFVHPLLCKFNITDNREATSFKICFSVPKRSFKSAVTRNRIRRQLREVVRLHKSQLEQQLVNDGKYLECILIYAHKEMPEYASLVKAWNKIVLRILQ